jgi:hypothetical protein
MYTLPYLIVTMMGDDSYDVTECTIIDAHRGVGPVGGRTAP